MTEVIVGLDLSLTRSAMCAVPSDWEQDWKRITVESVAVKLRGPERLSQIATRCADFVRRVGATAVYVEDYPRGLRSASVHALAELGGAVKVRLLDITGHVAEPVNISSARKLLLGKLPTGKGLAKRAVYEGLCSIGAPVNNDDEADAFCVANYGISERGWWCLSAA